MTIIIDMTLWSPILVHDIVGEHMTTQYNVCWIYRRPEAFSLQSLVLGLLTHTDVSLLIKCRSMREVFLGSS